jgi:HrpA-like RNA helicase
VQTTKALFTFDNPLIPHAHFGTVVGYSVRFESVTSPATRLLYATDGVVLREAMHDQLLSRFSIIIIDEAHERSLHTDLLLGVVKRAQRMRGSQSGASPKCPKLKVGYSLHEFYPQRR